MTSSDSDVYRAAPASSPATLDHLIGLCEEISALVRAGLPIEESLRQRSVRSSRKIETHLKVLAAKLGTGQSLAEAVRSDPVFPPVYAAVVEAGIRSGNLAGALDAIAHSARVLRETRLFLIRMSLYPLFLFTLLWCVLAGMFLFTGPRFAAFFDNFGATTLVLGLMQQAADNPTPVVFTVILVPVVVWVLFFLWCLQTNRSTILQSTTNRFLLCGIPWIGKAAIQLQKEAFAKIYAILLKASLPQEEAILLAAKASCDRFWSKESLARLQSRILDAQKPGEATKKSNWPTTPISSLIRWSLGISDQKLLVDGLDQYARISRFRAESLLGKCELFLPGILTFVCAAIVGACYVITIFWPYTELINHLSKG